MLDKKITLFYADWCGHCKTFKDQWQYIQDFAENNKNNLKKQGVNFMTEAFEADRNKKEVQRNKIDGFPTIRITENGNTRDYMGERNAHTIISTVLNLDDSQLVDMVKNTNAKLSGGSYNGFPEMTGGASLDDEYYAKYRKYKEKYIALKRNKKQ